MGLVDGGEEVAPGWVAPLDMVDDAERLLLMKALTDSTPQEALPDRAAWFTKEMMKTAERSGRHWGKADGNTTRRSR